MSTTAEEGHVRCPDCGARVPSFASLTDDGQPCTRATQDPTMHTRACTYCRDPETQAHLDWLLAQYASYEEKRDALTIGELRATVLGECSDAQRIAVARIGEDLFGLALCLRQTHDTAEAAAEFIAEARSEFGALADAMWRELGPDYQNLRGVELHPYRAHDPG